eukprot:TRINITY_DN5293_c0_g1_i1.p1 TRINITY_DN5293_c0_g1~~TRINITY_DN5293_c0_g1_i1.p1  ORF type:complete len:116 (-),score=16.05 TRINITY_DN5293_c0_g1_i1:113-460(-)
MHSHLRFAALVLVVYAHRLEASTIMRRDSQRASGPTQDGGCVNEGDGSVGNHCVKLTGAALDDFQEKTNQDFGNPSAWCVCLHLYADWKSKGGAGGGDCSACSSAAMGDAELSSC